MKLFLAATALTALLAGGSSAFAQDRSPDYASQTNVAAYNQQSDQANGQVINSGYTPANPDNLPRVPGALNQPGDPDAVTDNYTATHQPLLGSAGPVPAVAVPEPARDNYAQQ
jgi:hypothetical protein